MMGKGKKYTGATASVNYKVDLKVCYRKKVVIIQTCKLTRYYTKIGH